MVAAFSKLFSAQVHSWGKNNFLPVGDSKFLAATAGDRMVIQAEVLPVSEIGPSRVHGAVDDTSSSPA